MTDPEIPHNRKHQRSVLRKVIALTLIGATAALLTGLWISHYLLALKNGGK